MLADAQAKGHESFDKIILVGGATRMPQVRGRLVAEFGKEPEAYDPDEAVAKGAALFGLKESLQDEVKDIPRPLRTPTSAIDLDAVSESEVTEALDHLEKQLGFTLTGPVRELVNTRIVNVLSKSLGVVAKDDDNQEIVVYLLPRNSEVPHGTARRTSAPTPLIRRVSTSASWPANATAPSRPIARTSARRLSTCRRICPRGVPSASSSRSAATAACIVTATDLTGGGSIDVEFETEAVLNAEQVEARSAALRLLTVS